MDNCLRWEEYSHPQNSTAVQNQLSLFAQLPLAATRQNYFILYLNAQLPISVSHEMLQRV